MKNIKNTTTANITTNGNVTVNVTNNTPETATDAPLGTKESFSITENTTLGELLKLLNPGEKPHEIPTPKAPAELLSGFPTVRALHMFSQDPRHRKMEKSRIRSRFPMKCLNPYHGLWQ